MLGLLQRNEATTVFQLFRPSQLRADIAVVGPTIWATGLQIVSAKGEARTSVNDMLNVTSQVASVAYLYLLICYILASFTLGYLIVYRNQAQTYVSAMLESKWNLLTTLVDQENFKTSFWTCRILWTSFCIAIFFLIFGVLLNLMSVDGVVGQTPQRIDRVIDLFQGVYSKARVFMLTSFYYFESVTSAPKKSQLGMLYRRMRDTDDCSDTRTCNFNYADPRNATSAWNILESFNYAFNHLGNGFLVDEQMFDTLLKPYICVALPKLGSSMHYTSDKMESDYASVYFSRTTDPRVVRRMSYRLTSILIEAAVTKIGLLELLRLMSENGPVAFNETSFRMCREGVRLDGDGAPSTALSLTLFRKTCWLSIVGLVMAVIALSTECWAQRSAGPRCSRIGERCGKAMFKSNAIQLMGQQGNWAWNRIQAWSSLEETPTLNFSPVA
ncbi:hypothetical protein HDE_12217 [Halotydeus destructor]|nr:hypothetical protein HDE_12217 [Halotydeus destructor]